MRGDGRQCGFTLLELIVVLAISSVALLVGAFAAATAYDAARYRGFIRDVVQDLRAARAHALQSGETVAYVVDLDQSTAGIMGKERVAPRGIALDAIVARSESEPGGRGAIRFFPDGGATGGSIMVLRGNGDGVRVRVDWLLGRVSLEPVELP